MDDLRAFASELRGITPRIERAVGKVLDRDIPAIAQDASALAPRDRPWLGVIGQGIRFDTRGLSRRVYSPLDDRRVNLGLHVEYGTADTPPQPFLGPAFEMNSSRFESHVASAVEGVLR